MTDGVVVPSLSVPFGQRHRRAVFVEPRVATCVVEREQRKETHCLGGICVGVDERTGEPDREPAEVGANGSVLYARPIALVEQEMERAEHGVQTLATALGRRALDVALLA